MLETTGADVAAPETATKNEVVDDSIRSEDLVAQLIPSEDPPETEEPEGNENNEQDALARYGLVDLDDDARKELAMALGSGLGNELGQLRAENRQLRDSIQTELAKREPFETNRSSGKNPYSDISDMAELQTLHDNAVNTIKAGREALEDNETADPDEVIMTVEDRELTKKEVRAMVRRAEEARGEHLPNRANELKQLALYEDSKKSFDAQAEKTHAWLAEEGNELRAQFDRESAPIVDAIREKLPELYPQVRWILANHTAYLKGLGAKPAQPAATQSKKRPPAQPGASAAASSRPVSDDKKRAQFLDPFLKQGKSMTSTDMVAFLASKNS